MNIYRSKQLLYLVSFALIFLFVAPAGTAEKPDKDKARSSLAKESRAIDVAVALLDAGKAQHMMLNSHFSAFDWGDHGRPAGTYKGWSYVPSIFFCIGAPDGPWAPMLEDPISGEMVSMGPTVSGVARYPNDMLDSRQAPDWGPRMNSLGELHSGDVLFEEIYDLTSLDLLPIVATSTVPASWPRDADGFRFWPGFWAKDPLTGKVYVDTVAAVEFNFDDVSVPWRYVPGDDDRVLVGRFSADVETYFEINDYDLNNQGIPYAEQDDLPDQGYPLGIQVNVQGMSYGRSFAEDILFFPMEVINKSEWDYTDLYLTIVDDSDVPELITQPGSASLNDRMDWMTFLKSEYDADNDTTYAYNMAYIYDWRWGGAESFPGPEYKVVPAMKFLDSPFAKEGHPHYSDGIDNDGDGLIDEPVVLHPTTGKIIDGEKLGITAWHWYQWEDRPGEVETDRNEIMHYQLMSGDMTDITAEEDRAYFHPAPDGTLDPFFDSPAGIREDYPEGTDCMFEFTTGPFDLASGDTAVISFALVMGDDTTDVKFNARTAQFMYELYYQGADPPISPTVTAIAHDDSVTLYWDRAAESSKDIMTGYEDFEGYKIYRTTSEPILDDWGEQIYDGYGRVVGFVPVAQFDLNNSVSGLDPIYPYLNKGDNTGLAHKWTDRTVKNGVTYWYSVTAYDRGVVEDPELNPEEWAELNYLETAKGTNPGASSNLVMVVPGKVASNAVEPIIAVQPIGDTYAGNTVGAKIIDKYAITGHSYLISIDDSSASEKLYDVYDEDAGEYVLRSQSISATEHEFFDGLQMVIEEKFTSISFDPDSAEWYHESPGTPAQTNWTITASTLGQYGYNYELRYVGQDADTAVFPPTYTIPFEIWNLDTGRRGNFFHFSPSGTDTTDEMKATWTSGDQWNFQEVLTEGGPPKFTWNFTFLAPPQIVDTVAVQIDTTVTPPDTSYTLAYTDTSIAPTVGDVMRIVTGKPFQAGRDVFRLETAALVAREVQASDLDRIKVVPNPYVISAEWELSEYTKMLAFTNLPSVCDIHIYTLTGERVNTMHHESVEEGWLYWDMLNFYRQEIATGMYIYVVETPNGEKKIGKFAVIK